MVCFISFVPGLCIPTAAAVTSPCPAPQVVSLPHCPKSSLKHFSFFLSSSLPFLFSSFLPSSSIPPSVPPFGMTHVYLARKKSCGCLGSPKSSYSSSLGVAVPCPLRLAQACLGGGAGHPCPDVCELGSISWLAFAGLT